MSENFESRLIQAMSEMGNPSKSSTATVPTKSGKTYSYNYESLDSVLAVVRPPLLSHGIGLRQMQEWDDATGSYVLRTIVFDDDHTMVMDTRPIRLFDDAKGCGSWETYMRRYALKSAFGLAGEDDDGDATVGAGYAPQGARGRQQPAGNRYGTQAAQQAQTASEQALGGAQREKWVRRILELQTQCIQRGYLADDLAGYAAATYGTSDINSMSKEQMAAYGNDLSQFIEKAQSAGGDRDVDQQG